MAIRTEALLSAAAVCCAVMLACWGAARGRQSRTWLAFSAGILLLALDEILRLAVGFAAITEGGCAVERYRIALMALRPGFWLVFSLGYARGNAAAFFRRWRMVAIAFFAVPVAIAVGAWNDVLGDPAMEAGAYLIPLGTAGRALHVFTVIGLVMALDNLERTLRSAVGTLRWRIKYMVMGLGAIMIMRIYAAGQALLYSQVNWNAEALNTLALLLGGGMIALGMLRTRRVAVDLYPSPGTLRNSVAFLVAGVYLLLVGLLAQVSIVVGGLETLPLKNFVVMFALLGLTVMLLSDRVRLWGGDIARRCLRRPRHDYAAIWRSCAEKTASIVDPQKLCREMVGLVSATMEALSVTLWRVDEARSLLVPGASTAGSGKKEDQPGALLLDAPAQRAFVHDPRPFNLETRPEPWAATLQEAAPRVFPHGGDRTVLPLCAGGALLGLMVVGDRVQGRPLTGEDRALLETIGGYFGASLLNLRLSERLLEAREMEAFQKMSTFFIHDLKNTASSLSLLMDNFRVHADNPAFRQDALKAIEAGVTRLRDLIQRLGRLREVPEFNMQACDIETIVDAALKEITFPAGVRLVREGTAPPAISADPKPLGSVVANVVLNAIQSLPPAGGEIRITTGTADGQVVLTVRDNGCGISREFMEKSLFHPFRTTKSGGMGIGLFQSRMIVEGHKGRIEVETEEGRGTVFRIALPLAER